MIVKKLTLKYKSRDKHLNVVLEDYKRKINFILDNIYDQTETGEFFTGRGINTTLPLTGGGNFSATRTHSITGLEDLGTNNYLVGVQDDYRDGWEYKSLLGTTNQITVTHAVGSVTLSTPQDINITSNVQFGNITMTGELDITKATTLLIDLNPGFTGTGEVISMVPSAPLASVDAEWDGIAIDGNALDPSAIGTQIHGIHIDLSGVNVTNDPHIDALYVKTPDCLCGTHAIHSDGEIHLNLDVSASTTGNEYTGLDIVVATNTASAGVLHAIDVAKSGTGTISVVGLTTHTDIDVIHQHIGTFANADKIWEYDNDAPGWTDVTTGTGAIWDDKDDLLYIGHASTFSEIRFVFSVVATKDMHFKFYFSAGSSVFTEFNPADDTNGATQNGSVRFTASALSTWATDTVNSTASKYWIKIERTRTSGTAPTKTAIQQLAPTQYSWDKTGAITALSANLVNTITEFSTDGTMGDNTDSAVPTEAAVVTYVAAQITAEDLDYGGDTGTGAVDLNSQTFTFTGTDPIDTAASAQTLTISHKTTDGYKHIPTTGASAQILQYSAAGTAKWITVSSEASIADNGAITLGGSPTFSNVTIADSGSISLQEDITFTGATNTNLILFPDDLQTALAFRQAGNSYLTFKTTDGSEEVIFSKVFSGITSSTIGNLTFADGSITDSSDSINFGNEALSTTGTLGAGNATLGTVGCGLITTSAGITNTTGALTINDDAGQNVTMFASAAAGENPVFYVYGDDTGAPKYGSLTVAAGGTFRIESEAGENIRIDAGNELFLNYSAAGDAYFFSGAGAGENPYVYIYGRGASANEYLRMRVESDNDALIESEYDLNINALGGEVSFGAGNLSTSGTLNVASNLLSVGETALKIGVNTTSPNAEFQIEKDQASSRLYLRAFKTAAAEGIMRFGKARGSQSSPTTVADTDLVGSFYFQGYDGDSWENLGAIQGYVNGAVSDGVVPGKIDFSTSNAAGASTAALRLTASQQVKLPGIATTDAGDYDLRYDAADGIVYDTSDNRQKSNKALLEYGLSEVLQLQPKRYTYHVGLTGLEEDEKTKKPKKKDIEITNKSKDSFGLIAQEVFDIIPEAVYKPEDEKTAFWGLRYKKLIPILINAIKELNDKIKVLEAQ